MYLLHKVIAQLKEYEKPEMKELKYSPEITEEIESIIKEFEFDCTVEDFKNCKDVDWDHLSMVQRLSEDFIREFQDKVDWEAISGYGDLSENFVREFMDEFDWDTLSSEQILPEELIVKFQDQVNWMSVSVYQEVSEDFIREFQDKVDWEAVVHNQKLSEDFIREFQGKVDWGEMYRYNLLPNLSKDFLREMIGDTDHTEQQKEKTKPDTETVKENTIGNITLNNVEYDPGDGSSAGYLSYSVNIDGDELVFEGSIDDLGFNPDVMTWNGQDILDQTDEIPWPDLPSLNVLEDQYTESEEEMQQKAPQLVIDAVTEWYSENQL